MPTTNIPITLSPIPVPTGVEAVNINDLLSIISEYMTGQISTSVSFFIQNSVPPTSDQGIFYNTTTFRFERWNSVIGAYQPISEITVGDMKASLLQSDDVANGWILMNGRSIANVANITQVQKNNLLNLFPTGILPNYVFLSGLGSLPASNAFTSISNPSITPTPGTVGSITISATYQQSEITTLRNNTETLLGSTNTLQIAVANIQDYTNAILQSLLGTSTVFGPKWFVFCGYPS